MIVLENKLENKVEKVTFESVKFGGVVLKKVGNNVRQSDVKMRMPESSTSIRKIWMENRRKLEDRTQSKEKKNWRRIQ